jgi:hypothetical protein
VSGGGGTCRVGSSSACAFFRGDVLRFAGVPVGDADFFALGLRRVAGAMDNDEFSATGVLADAPLDDAPLDDAPLAVASCESLAVEGADVLPASRSTSVSEMGALSMVTNGGEAGRRLDAKMPPETAPRVTERASVRDASCR